MGNKNSSFNKESNQPKNALKNIGDKCSLDIINSKFILDNIFKYLSLTSTKYKLELIKYSKSLQQKLNIDLNDYKYEFLSSKINIYSYLTLDYSIKNFDKNDLYKKAEERIKLKSINLSINEIVDITKKYNEKYRKNEKRTELDTLLYNSIGSYDSCYDIYCPFIDFSSYNDNLFFKIPLNYIEKYNLKNDYISFFEKNTKSNNLLYIIFDKNEQINILKEIKIDFSKIKILYFRFDYNSEQININNLFLSEMFLLIDNKNNLESLCFDLLRETKIDSDAFNSLNNLKALKHIEFNYLEFSKPFKIILSNLENISFSYCKNIYFENENTTKNIKYLVLNSIDIQFGSKYKFDNLEELDISDSIIDIDYNSLKNLKLLDANKIEIIENIMKYSSIEKLKAHYTREEEKKLIEIILMNKTLKEINIHFSKITNEELTNINLLNNNQINNIYIMIEKNNLDINNFVKKFVNLKKLSIFPLLYSSEKQFTEIINDENINIDEIYIFSNINTKISFSFSNIKRISLRLPTINTLSFSLLNKKCNDIFNSLELLNIESLFKINNFEILENLSNNIEKCKNLKILFISVLIKKMNKSSYLNIINKILSIKIHIFSFTFIIEGKKDNNNGDYMNTYSKKELKLLFPNKIYDCYSYNIQKI